MELSCKHWNKLKNSLEDQMQVEIVKATLTTIPGVKHFHRLRFSHWVSPEMITTNTRFITENTEHIDDIEITFGEKNGGRYITFKDTKQNIEETIERNIIGELE